MVAFGYKDQGIKNEENRRAFKSDNKHDAWKPKYPHNFVEKEKCGHIFERDSTPDHERINVRHCSGTGFEYLFDGTRLDIVNGNKYTYIKGGVSETIERGYDSKVVGNRRNLVDGGYHGEVKGNHTMAVGGDSAVVYGGGHTIQTAQNYNIGANKSVVLTSGQNSVRVSLDPNGTCTIAATGDICIRSEAKLTLKGESVNIAAGSLELGYDNLKVPQTYIPNWRVHEADHAGTALSSPLGAGVALTIEQILAKNTNRGEQDGINQQSKGENQSNVLKGYQATGTQEA